jgi:hypothetical protein
MFGVEDLINDIIKKIELWANQYNPNNNIWIPEGSGYNITFDPKWKVETIQQVRSEIIEFINLLK